LDRSAIAIVSTILTCLISDASRLRILKRRLAWLIGEWASIEAEPTANPDGSGNTGAYATVVKQDLVWQILVHLLNERGETTDKAVQLSAALAIKKSVDVRPQSETARSR
jgi:hypothetical protein